MLDERDGSFGSRWLLITRGLRNVAPLAERTRRIPSRAERARSRSDTLQVSPRDQSSHHWHCFIDLACAGGGGLRRLRSALPHTRGSFTAQSPPLNHLHLIIFSILAFGPPPRKKKKLLINSNGGLTELLRTPKLPGESGNGCSCAGHICWAPNTRSCLRLS